VTAQRIYQLFRSGNLLLLRAAVGGRDNRGVQALNFLVDTGSSYTTLPVKVVEDLGFDIQNPLRNIRITAGSSIIEAPVVAVSWFSCLGERIENFPIVAYTLPRGTFWQGILGMDFLISCQAVIAVGEAQIRISQ
jgi:predicted aspartyl protease